MNPNRLAAVLVIVALAISPAYANSDPNKGRVTTNPTKGNKYTIEQDVQLGRQVVPEAEKQLKLLPANHPTSKYINDLGQKLAAKAPGYKFPYTFKVVQDQAINAFALPGGPIYMNAGTIQAASEAELAGVLGHEIAHVVMRHSTRQATSQMKAQVPIAILSGVLGVGVGGAIGSLAQLGLSIGAGGIFMKYSRDAETEADKVGAQIICDTGYNPRAMATFFEKLKAQSGGKGGGFLASHPDPGDRAKNINAILSRFPAKEYQSADSPEYLAAKKALGDVKLETPQEAEAREEYPSTSRLSPTQLAVKHFSSLDHVAFQLSYPSNWRVSGDKNSSLTIYPEGGVAQGSVAYGAIFSGFKPRGGTKNLDGAMQELITNVQQTNQDLKPAGKVLDVMVSGRDAKSVEMLGKSAVLESGKPVAERVRLVALPGQKGIMLYCLFIGPDQDFDAMRPAFDRMLLNFKVK